MPTARSTSVNHNYRSATTSSVLSALDASLARLSSQAAQRTKQSEENEKFFNQNLKEVADKIESRPGAGTKRTPKGGAVAAASRNERAMEDDGMEIDEPSMEITGKGKNRKYVPSLVFFAGSELKD